MDHMKRLRKHKRAKDRTDLRKEKQKKRKTKRLYKPYQKFAKKAFKLIGQKGEFPVKGMESTEIVLQKVHQTGRFYIRAYEVLLFINAPVSRFLAEIEDFEEYPLKLLEESFVDWAERKFSLGYPGLVGEMG